LALGREEIRVVRIGCPHYCSTLLVETVQKVQIVLPFKPYPKFETVRRLELLERLEQKRAALELFGRCPQYTVGR